MSGEGKVVCVTGASGFIASWLVKLLLLRRYTVHATLRTLDDPKKTEHLLSLQGATERLRLFKSDLSVNDSFDSAINGCHGVFHTASPCTYHCNDPQTDLIDPAVNGTINVLRSCAKHPCVKRVVLTSSIAAVLHTGRSLSPEVVVDESWFSDPEFCRKHEKWYPLSKTLAEEAAWRFAEDNGIDLVVINPSWVIGPSLQPTLNESSAVISHLVGAKSYPNNACGWVHIKDVAEAHIRALEVQSANGRYCIVERVVHYSDIVKILREAYPTLQLPDKCVDDKPRMSTWEVSKEKAMSLGVGFTPLEICLQDTVQSLKDKKFI